MGKNHKHIKQLKSEKSKVKLKAKILPKGTNVTNTTFKIKKIVIREQLRDKSQSDDNFQLQIKELLSRLNHHNHNALLDALKEAKTLLETKFLFIYLHKLESFLKGLAQLSLHEEAKVRRESFKVLYTFLIAIIEHNCNESDLKPYFETLSSYLCCAMTHIDPKVKEDSLLFLDVLLNAVPTLVVSTSTKIFNNFLDFISKLREGSKSRNLTLSLNSSLTSLKWRMKVFERLGNMLRFMVTNNIQKQNVDVIFNNHAMENNSTLPTRRPDYLGYRKNSNATNKLNTADIELKNYIEVIFPLLFDTWMEIKPNKRTDIEHNMRTNLISEYSELMFNVLDIMTLLWNYVKNIEYDLKNKDMSSWFVRKFSKTFNEILLEQFPYENNYSHVQNNSRGRLSGNINYLIAYLGVTFNPEPKDDVVCKKISNYLLQLLGFVKAGRKSNIQDDLNIYILSKTILIDVSNKWKNWICINDLLESILDIVNQEDSKNIGKYLQTLLIEIALSPELYHLNTYRSFNNWLVRLPTLLTEDISKQELYQLCSIANQKNKSFIMSLTQTLPLIINKVTTKLKTEEDAQCFARLLKEIIFLLSNEERNSILENISENCNKVLSTNIFLILLH